VSSEMDLDKLIDTLMVVALEHAGADRGLLILPRGEELGIEAEAKTIRDMVKVRLRQTPVTSTELPESLVRYVIRSHDSVLLDDASERNVYSGDQYLLHNYCRSILCVPLIKQARLIGVLYLENNQTSHVFTPARLAVLKLLASQAAISLENARLYAELMTENSERRRAEQALRASEASLAEGQRISRTGSWRWNVRTGAVQWSAEFFRILGFDPAVDQPSYAKGMARIHPEDRALVERALADAVRERNVFKGEYRILLHDGSIKYLQTTGHPDIDETGEVEFVGTVMDTTERRHAEEALRRTQAELARASRLTTMGELAGSIIHEINQPLAAVLGNAEVCRRWLNRDPPELTEARDAISRLEQDGRRAADVVKGLRALARKSDLELTNVDINDAIQEVLALLRGELEGGAVVLQVDLVAADRPVLGDRVQLQQVLLNLIRNGIEAMSAVADRRRILRLSAQPNEMSEVLIAVEDSGTGLAPATVDRVFDPLFTTKPNGMGMGLAICRSIVEAHRGRLWASPNLPHGTTFQFTVPLIAVRKINQRPALSIAGSLATQAAALASRTTGYFGMPSRKKHT
jgi:PAS domain S-box-containing protein